MDAFTPRDAFALAVRIAGLICLVFAAFDALVAAAAVVGISFETKHSAATDAVGAAIYLLVGLPLLFGARPITRWVYGQGP